MTRDKASTSAQAKREKLYKVKRKSQIQNLDKCTRVRCGTTWLSHTVGFIRPVRVKFMKLYRIHIPRENYPLSSHKLPLLRGKRGKNNHCQYIFSPPLFIYQRAFGNFIQGERDIQCLFCKESLSSAILYSVCFFIFLVEQIHSDVDIHVQKFLCCGIQRVTKGSSFFVEILGEDFEISQGIVF